MQLNIIGTYCKVGEGRLGGCVPPRRVQLWDPAPPHPLPRFPNFSRRSSATPPNPLQLPLLESPPHPRVEHEGQGLDEGPKLPGTMLPMRGSSEQQGRLGANLSSSFLSHKKYTV